MDKHVCMPDNAATFKRWLAERGGLAIWESVDLGDLDKSWTTPATHADGSPATKPHWKAGDKPARLITDPAEVVVEVPRLLEKFDVKLRIHGMGVVLAKSSEKKLHKRLAYCREQYKANVWYTTGPLDFPEVCIWVAEKTVPLAEYLP